MLAQRLMTHEQAEVRAPRRSARARWERRRRARDRRRPRARDPTCWTRLVTG